MIKEYLKKYAPVLGVGFAIGLSIGVMLNLWVLNTLFP